MKKTLGIAIAYYSLLAYIFLNALLTKLAIAPFEAVLITTELGILRMRHLFCVVCAIAIAALMTHKKTIRDSFVPVFSISLTAILGFVMLICVVAELNLNRWVLVIILSLASLVLELLLETLSFFDALEDFAFSYTLVGLFIELLNWIGIPLVSWDSFLISAFFGLIQVWLAYNCHVLPEPKEPEKPKETTTKVTPKKKDGGGT